MGCFNGWCSLTGVPILDNDRVVVIELRPREHDLLMGTLTESVFNELHGWMMVAPLAETLPELATELAPSPYTFAARGCYDDYGGMHHNGKGWRPGGGERDRSRWAPYAMVHERAFEEARTKGKQYLGRRLWAEEETLLGEGTPVQTAQSIYLVLNFAVLAGKELFHVAQARTGQGYEAERMHAHARWSEIVDAQRERTYQLHVNDAAEEDDSL